MIESSSKVCRLLTLSKVNHSLTFSGGKYSGHLTHKITMCTVIAICTIYEQVEMRTSNRGMNITFILSLCNANK